MFSRGIMAIPHLAAFLPEVRSLVHVRTRVPGNVDSIAGWGRKPTSERARREAAKRNLPYLALEDGFIRSLGPAAKGYPPLSLIVDPVGIYYDATRPCALENLLEDAPEGELPLEEAQDALDRIRALRLSKINGAPELAPGELELGDKPLVLVIDQVRGDMAVTLGLAGERQFHAMLDAALDENPGATVLVKLHPEVAAGRREGYLAARARRLGTALLERDVNLLSLLERTQRVYTVTSQVGMEALVCGARVTCFGLPFYAGWGATDDRATCPRRTRRRSALEIFAAAYVRYPRYVDPLTGELCPIGRVLARLAVMKRANERNRGHTECLGFSRWKRRQIAPFFRGTDASLRFARSAGAALERAAAKQGRVCVWASREPADLAARAEQAGVPLVRVEDGFLRSVGLGSDFLPGASLVFDRDGIYYDPRRPSELETILETAAFDAETLDQAARLRARLLQTGITKYNTGRAAPAGIADDPRRRILVPGQVEDDASVRAGGGAIQTNLDLLRVVRARCPDACIAYKSHPDVEAGNRRGRIGDADLARACDVVLRDVAPDAAIAAVDEVHTLTSLLGFEALLRGRRVVTYGGPFYAGWGLTEDLLPFPRRTRRLTLDELVAGALILYPDYVDPVTGLACDALTVVERLAAARYEAPRAGLRHAGLWRQIRRMLRGLAWATRQAA